MNEDKQALLDSYGDLFEALDKKGIIHLHDDQLAQTFREHLKGCPVDVPFLAEHGLSLVFFFDWDEKPEELHHHGGMTVRFTHPDTDLPDEYAIGIARQRIEMGKEATLDIWLHEAAHVFHGLDVTAHDLRFHQLQKILVDACAAPEAPAPQENILERLRKALRGHRSGSSRK